MHRRRLAHLFGLLLLWLLGVPAEVLLYAVIVEDAASTLGMPGRATIWAAAIGVPILLGWATWHWITAPHRERRHTDRRHDDRRHEQREETSSV
jgi:hypothetical protein